ncbi:hypothetical protein BTM25_19340 [Actinomadura rubteroloni]|uniref:Molecular chaperone DnaJ n=1 Tax=Actinomadura rubteroloni TaxID=1926885 RepID=A0A2P4UR46_9ACTN|nr:hypothetical protein [Actinomadura rubteroloni]POM27518.1 hypothetical protein BTM25_19340 [Actinomadura rubteroloni]
MRMIPAGIHMLCPCCGGAGVRPVPRATVQNGEISTAVSPENCRPCEGTGWLPPKHDDPSPGAE